jgi:hypothetical protein
MSEEIYCTVWTKDEKQKLTHDQWCLFKNSNLHRTDGPAVEFTSGTKYWYLNGNRHRVDGPAVEHSSGSKYWYLNGKRHREDGPAIEYFDGTKKWYLDDQHYSEQNFNQAIQKVKEMNSLERLLDERVWVKNFKE